MKRVGNLYSKICNKGNIYKAISKAGTGKKSRKNVKRILDNQIYYTDLLYEILKNKKYRPNPYREIKIQDGVRKKERIIYKPQFYPDQIIHWALMLQLEPILMRGMYYYCCGSVKNRGILHGARYIKKILIQDRKNTKYCLKLDVKKFYPSINKEKLKYKFLKILKCRDTLDLIDQIIDSSKEGLPIGNYTSQWFANFYLQDLDHYIKEELHMKYYIRYMDDMVLFHRNKRELHKIKEKIEIFLKSENLNLKENWQLFRTDSRPLDFLGYRFYRGYTTLRRNNCLRIRRRIKRIYKKGKLSVKDARAVLSYNGWLKYSNSHNYTKKYIKPYISINKCKEVIKNARRK
jgi:hypothetical protein